MELLLTAEKCSKEELAKSKQKLETKLEKVQKELGAERDKLQSELKEMSAHLELVKQNCVGLEQSLASEKDEKAKILNEKESLSCRLSYLDKTVDTMNKEMIAKEESITNLQV